MFWVGNPGVGAPAPDRFVALLLVGGEVVGGVRCSTAQRQNLVGAGVVVPIKREFRRQQFAGRSALAPTT